MCDTVVVVRDSRVFFAKNSDRDPNEAQALDWQPARTHPAGATVRCTHVEIAQARETRAVLLSRPFWMWGAEMGANDVGVVAGNEAVFTTNAVPARGGLTGMDILRLALERASSAEAAVEIAIALHETHGQGGRMGHEDPNFRYWSSFLFADATGAFVLETAGRRLWEVERVTAGVRSISNGLTIPKLADAYADRLRTRVAHARERRACTTSRGSTARSVRDMFALLRDHGGATPRYTLATGAMGAPCMHAGGLVASSQSVASWVSELGPRGAKHWVTATAAPCTSLFKPVRVTEALDLGPWPTDTYDARCTFWRHEALHRAAMRDPEKAARAYFAERDATEARWVESPPEPEEAFAEAERWREKWTARLGRTEERRPLWVRRTWAVRDRRAKMEGG